MTTSLVVTCVESLEGQSELPCPSGFVMQVKESALLTVEQAWVAELFGGVEIEKLIAFFMASFSITFTFWLASHGYGLLLSLIKR